MKKTILSMFAALALLGCNNEPTPSAPTDLEAIGFGTVDTRADADLSTLMTDGFGVWAYINNSTVQNHLLMENQLVEYDVIEDKWFYSPVKYWLDDTVFSFVGVYPYDENGTYYSLDAANAAVKLTVSETPSVVDFLIAKNETNTSVEYDKTVNLQFKHMLTSVGLNIWRDQAKHTNDQMRIKRVTLSNISKGGKYSTAENSWTYNDEKLSMEYENTNLSDTDNIGAVIVKDDGTLDPGGSEAVNPFGNMMLLPQTVGDDNVVTLKIEYDLKLNNATSWTSEVLETTLPTTTWDAGRRYTYNVVLSKVTNITVYYIQTKVDPWGTPQVGGTVIIK